MKVYYEFDPIGEDQADELKRALYEGWKYQVMWELRFLEKEIADEGDKLFLD